jgi:hypothetical protein
MRSGGKRIVPVDAANCAIAPVGPLLSQNFLAFDLALNLLLTRLEEDWKPTGSRAPQAG